MKTSKRTSILIAIGVAALVLAGCSRGERSIEGQVTIDGQPLAGAQLTFEPLDRSGKIAGAIAMTDALGAFAIEPHPVTGESLATGTYSVSVSRKIDPQGNVPIANDLGQLQAAGLLRESIPPRYSFQPGVPPALSAQIVEGDNQIRLELQSR